jgi:hypothetical protein
MASVSKGEGGHLTMRAAVSKHEGHGRSSSFETRARSFEFAELIPRARSSG